MDIIISFKSKDREAVFKELVTKIEKAFSDHYISANLDLDMTE